ncbi:MAG: class I SAM-dependent methyltransferase [Mycobacterium sp.]
MFELAGPREFNDVWHRISTVPGYSTDRAESMMLYAAGKLSTGPVVEVGSFLGRSTCFLAAGAEIAGQHVWAVDPWEGGTGDPGSQNARNQVDVQPMFESNLRRTDLQQVVTGLRGSAAQVAPKWTNGEISVLFIDGLHDYNGVMNDYVSFAPHLAADCRLIFDDYAPAEFPGVREAVDEIAEMRGATVHVANRFALLDTSGFALVRSAGR